MERLGNFIQSLSETSCASSKIALISFIDCSSGGFSSSAVEGPLLLYLTVNTLLSNPIIWSIYSSNLSSFPLGNKDKQDRISERARRLKETMVEGGVPDGIKAAVAVGKSLPNEDKTEWSDLVMKVKNEEMNASMPPRSLKNVLIFSTFVHHLVQLWASVDYRLTNVGLTWRQGKKMVPPPQLSCTTSSA